MSTAAMVEALEPIIDDVTTRYRAADRVRAAGREPTWPPRSTSPAPWCGAPNARASRPTRDGWLGSDSQVVPYLNRLADLVYTLARWQEGHYRARVLRPTPPDHRRSRCRSVHRRLHRAPPGPRRPARGARVRRPRARSGCRRGRRRVLGGARHFMDRGRVRGQGAARRSRCRHASGSARGARARRRRARPTTFDARRAPAHGAPHSPGQHASGSARVATTLARRRARRRRRRRGGVRRSPRASCSASYQFLRTSPDRQEADAAQERVCSCDGGVAAGQARLGAGRVVRQRGRVGARHRERARARPSRRGRDRPQAQQLLRGKNVKVKVLACAAMKRASARRRARRRPGLGAAAALREARRTRPRAPRPRSRSSARASCSTPAACRSRPRGGMETMKTDMGGARRGASRRCRRCATLGVKTRVIGYVPLVENMPSGNAIRPGDVLTIRNGKTVEVLNTDAEGRLILADALVARGRGQARRHRRPRRRSPARAWSRSATRSPG